MLYDVKHSDGIKEMLFFVFASPGKVHRYKLNKPQQKVFTAKPINKLTVSISTAIIIVMLLLSQFVVAQEINQVNLPTPKGKDLLFFLQRTPDANTVIYEVNYKSEGLIDPNSPIKGSWIRYAENGQYKALTGIEKKFAYGVKCKAVGNDGYEIRLAAYQKMPMYLLKSADQKYRIYIKDEGKNLLLKRVFVKVNGGSFWFPKVQYIDLFTIHCETGAEMMKRINLG